MQKKGTRQKNLKPSIEGRPIFLGRDVKREGAGATHRKRTLLVVSTMETSERERKHSEKYSSERVLTTAPKSKGKWKTFGTAETKRRRCERKREKKKTKINLEEKQKKLV